MMLYQGETTSNIFLVQSGIIRAYTNLNNGNEVIIALFGPGDYFPSSFDASELPLALFYYDALTDGQIERIAFEDFYSDASMQQRQSGFFDRRYTGALLHISALVQLTAAEKLYHILRYLTLRFGMVLRGKIFTRINVKLTQQNMADLCGFSRETANIELNKLKSAGVVVERNKYYSVDLKSLNKLIGDDNTHNLNL